MATWLLKQGAVPTFPFIFDKDAQVNEEILKDLTLEEEQEYQANCLTWTTLVEKGSPEAFTEAYRCKKRIQPINEKALFVDAMSDLMHRAVHFSPQNAISTFEAGKEFFPIHLLKEFVPFLITMNRKELTEVMEFLLYMDADMNKQGLSSTLPSAESKGKVELKQRL